MTKMRDELSRTEWYDLICWADHHRVKLEGKTVGDAYDYYRDYCRRITNKHEMQDPERRMEITHTASPSAIAEACRARRIALIGVEVTT